MTRLPWVGAALALCVSFGSFASAQSTGDRMKVMQARVLGLDLFTEHCASCHGRSGHGNGPRSEDLKVKASDLRRLAERNSWTFPSAAVKRVIEGADAPHRSRDMPLWGEVFRAGAAPETPDATTRIDALVHYLEFIQYRPRR